MNENSRVHYQTSFRTQAANPEHCPLFALQNIIYSWVYKKESDRVIKEDKKAFITKCDWPNLFKTHSWIATSTYYSDEGKCWALRYTECQSQNGRRRYWYTDIGIRKNNAQNEAIFYCKISYASSEFDLSCDELPKPSSNTPRFIRSILSSKSGLSVYSEHPSFKLLNQPAKLKLKSGHGLATLIESEKRSYTLVIFNGETKDFIQQANVLARALAGKAQIILLDQDPEFADELRYCLKKELMVYHGTFRVFFPIRRNKIPSSLHRHFRIDDENYHEQRNTLVNNLLKNYTLSETDAVKNISEVSRMISRSKLLEGFKKGENTEKDLEAFFEEYTKLEEEKSRVEQERDYYLEEHSELETETAELRSKLEASLYNNSRMQGELQICYQSHLGKLPENLEETVKVKAELLKERIIFTEGAHKSAADYSKCSSLDHAWKILYHIGTTLYDIKFGGQPAGDIEKRFKELSGYEYAKSEGPKTKGNSRLNQSRKIEHNGREYELWPHVKYGNEEPKLIRVYFDYDDDLKKIVVGHVGPHLDNATTRKKR